VKRYGSASPKPGHGVSSRCRACWLGARNYRLLRRVLRSWQKFKPGRIEGALTMLEEVLV
jgi:hypothetical protein